MIFYDSDSGGGSGVSDFTGEIGSWLQSLDDTPTNGGLVQEQDSSEAQALDELKKREAAELAPYDQAANAIQESGVSAYGDPERWAGSPVTNLDHFQPQGVLYSKPWYQNAHHLPFQMIEAGSRSPQVAQRDELGNITGYESANGSPLQSGSNRMSSQKWVDTFGQTPNSWDAGQPNTAWSSPIPTGQVDIGSRITSSTNGKGARISDEYGIGSSNMPIKPTPDEAYVY